MLTIEYLLRKSHDTALEKGWWENHTPGDKSVIPEKLLLIVTEIAEATEDLRNRGPIDSVLYEGGDDRRKPMGFAVELADVLIRVADLCARFQVPLEAALVAKMAYNSTRPHRHGNKAL